MQRDEQHTKAPTKAGLGSGSIMTAPSNGGDELGQIIEEMLTQRLRTNPSKPMYYGDYEQRIIQCIRRQDRNALVERVEAKKRIGTSKHGNCCTCEKCKMPHDECACEHNRALSQAQQVVRDYYGTGVV